MCVRMAEGVGNAAVVVPFMTEKYESSTNCKLELKFSQQVGRDSNSFCSHISLRLANELPHVGFSCADWRSYRTRADAARLLPSRLARTPDRCGVAHTHTVYSV